MISTYWDKHAGPDWDRAVRGADAVTRVLIRQRLIAGDYRSILDVGCGRAVDAEALMEAGIIYQGADLTRRFVDDCAARGVPVAHCHSDQLPAGPFDAVVCRHLFEHLTDPGPTLRAMVAAARRTVFIVLAAPPGELDELSYDFSRDLHCNVWGRATWAGLLKSMPKVVDVAWDLVRSGQGHGNRDEVVLTVGLA